LSDPTLLKSLPLESIGRIRLPEICGNVCFGGPKRNRLFMAASQSLYAVFTGTQGAAPG
jgi:gluconolactonase